MGGTIFELFGGIEFRPWQHFGIGLAYTLSATDLTISNNNNKYDVDYDYSGPLLYLVAGF